MIKCKQCQEKNKQIEQQKTNMTGSNQITANYLLMTLDSHINDKEFGRLKMFDGAEPSP